MTGPKKNAKALRIEKHKDTSIQGTNNSSIASKRSVEMLYCDSTYEKQFLKYFVPKPARRSPAINRGYWIRMEAIRRSVEKIMDHENGDCFVIVNLGCGYDPLPFQMLDKQQGKKVFCIDIDYPELISKKVEMIKQSKELRELIGDEVDGAIKGVQLRTSKYVALGCNLRDLDLLEKQWGELGLYEPTTCAIFVAEVSLAYMDPEHADSVISLSSKVSSSHFLILEQLLPVGPYHPFSRTMLYHFDHLSTSLKCVSQYPTLEDQRNRFLRLGFSSVTAGTLLDHWKAIDSDTKARIENTEPFDEWEEFVLFCQHYIVLHASNSGTHGNKVSRLNSGDLIRSNLDHSEKFTLSVDASGASRDLERRFPAAAEFGPGSTFIHGGLSQSRLGNGFITDKSKLIPDNKDMKSRMCHTISNLENELILVGGRSSPGRLFSDCWKFVDENWEQIASLPSPRWRHCSSVLNNEEILIFGGSAESDKPLFLKYNATSNQWMSLYVNQNGVSKRLTQRISACMHYNQELNQGFILGGIAPEDYNQGNEIDDALYRFSYNKVAQEIVVEKCFSHPQFARFGAKLSHSRGGLVLVGGVCHVQLLDSRTTVIEIDIVNRAVRSIEFSSDDWKRSPMLVGFELLGVDKKMALCGGAVCYAFGSVWNLPLLIESVNVIEAV